MKIGNFNSHNKDVYVIAELSANHNGKLEYALASIKKAKEIGANAIKLQTYKAESMTIECNKSDFIIQGGTLWDNKNLYELYKNASTPREWHKELFDYAKKIGVDIFSSVFDKSDVDFVEQFNPVAYKIASFEITDYELVRYVASKQRPMIISTGIATIEEIQDVVSICKEAGNTNIALLQCTSSYPAPISHAKLLKIPDLNKKFGVASGLSDHTMGIVAPIAAVSLGAKIIEKHFILDKSIGGLDCEFSLDSNEFAKMVRAVRDAVELLGDTDYCIDDKKQFSRKQFSRSLYVIKGIQKGEVFSEQNIKSIRPGHGMHPKHLGQILGKRADRDYEFAEAFNTDLSLLL